MVDVSGFMAAYDAVVDGWPVPVERLDLVSDYGTTRVMACGPADGRPLVLLHGGGTTAAVWFANVKELSRSRRVYAVDRIGEAGGSVRGERPVGSSGALLDWLDGVLDGLGLDQADLCGHSYGAWIALSYAVHAPHRVGRLVLLDPTRCFAGLKPGYLLRALPLLLRPTARRARSFLAWETGGAATDPEWLELYGRAAEFPHSKAVVGRRPRPETLKRLPTPTLVVLAADSRVHDIRKVEAAADLCLPDAETAVLPGVSHHGMPFVQADPLNRAILRFTS